MPKRGSSGSGSYYSDYYGDYFPPSRPREVKGGIKAQSQSGGFGASWWAKRWIAVLESFEMGTRLSRGRSYARKGQVLDIAIARGAITARVQGSRPRPYDVRINVATLAQEAWERVARVIGGQAIFAAKFLNGEMPQDIEEAFRAANVSLFPERMDDLDTSCSCPDWSNPCKHIAAVYYLIGEEFDRDPFLLFTLRGLGREDLLALLRPWIAPAGDIESAASEETLSAPPEPLPSDCAAFWAGQPAPPDERGEPRAPPVVAALPHRLGRFPFWRGEQPLLAALEPTYRAASTLGSALYAGDYAPTVDDSPVE